MATYDRQTTAEEDRVPWKQLVAYGMGGFIPIALFNSAGQLIGVLGNISLGLHAFWLGVIMILPRLWDAISDPLMGHISDNTRTRWGRRRPYILLGGILVALGFVALWWIPRGEWIRGVFPTTDAYNWFQLVYILGALLAFFTATTIFEIPHGALGMEMSGDYHERTRLFSAKSFFGNVFAMVTPWLLTLATLQVFAGVVRDPAEGMRYLSLLIAAALVPLSVWWFASLTEPRYAVAQAQQKSAFWAEMRTAVSNRTFLRLVAIIFTVAMGFDFISLLSYYINIFYLYDGDYIAAAPLLGVAGTVWGITGVLAVFPLNWLSRRFGKSNTLLLAIILMCAAQLCKIFCYNPTYPYLVLIPTILLSAGMLMFFTLGSSMVADICDEDELQTGTRSEGSFYAVYWWFIKMGRAFASFGTGALLLFTAFDERQNKTANDLQGAIAVLKAGAEQWGKNDVTIDTRLAKLDEQINHIIESADNLKIHFSEGMKHAPERSQHFGQLIDRADDARSEATSMRLRKSSLASDPAQLAGEAETLLEHTMPLKRQRPQTLFRLRLVDIGLPLVLSCVSILLTLGYPLTEARCYEIKDALEKRRAKLKTK